MKTKPDAEKPGQAQAEVDDTALHNLSKTERKKLNMDSWEPSLLRKLLKAQNRLKPRN